MHIQTVHLLQEMPAMYHKTQLSKLRLQHVRLEMNTTRSFYKRHQCCQPKLTYGAMFSNMEISGPVPNMTSCGLSSNLSPSNIKHPLPPHGCRDCQTAGARDHCVGQRRRCLVMHIGYCTLVSELSVMMTAMVATEIKHMKHTQQQSSNRPWVSIHAGQMPNLPTFDYRCLHRSFCSKLVLVSI